MNGIIIFLYLVEKPGKVYRGGKRLNRKEMTFFTELNVNIPERWGRKSSRKIIQEFAWANIAKT